MTSQNKRYLQVNDIQPDFSWKFPRFLLNDSKYTSLTNDERIAYFFIRNKFYTSEEKWEDEKGAYIYLSIEELRTKLHVGKNKVIRIKKHLSEIGLIEIEHSKFDPLHGQGFPDKFYLLTSKYKLMT